MGLFLKTVGQYSASTYEIAGFRQEEASMCVPDVVR